MPVPVPVPMSDGGSPVSGCDAFQPENFITYLSRHWPWFAWPLFGCCVRLFAVLPNEVREAVELLSGSLPFPLLLSTEIPLLLFIMLLVAIMGDEASSAYCPSATAFTRATLLLSIGTPPPPPPPDIFCCGICTLPSAEEV